MPRRFALFAVPALVLVLAGCVPTTGPSAAPTDSAVPTPAATGTPTPGPTATPTPGPDSVPIAFTCSDILSPQAIYDYNPNVSLLSDYSPEATSLAGEAVTRQGIACRLINQSSGETIDIGIVQFTESAFAKKASSLAATSTPAGAFEGYFDVTGGEGVAEAVSDPYWLTVTSATFVEAADASQVVDAVVGSLP